MIDKEESWRIRAEKNIDRINNAFPNPEFENWVLCEKLILNAIALSESCIRILGISSSKAIQLLHKMTCYLYEQGRYNQCEPWMQLALTISERSFDDSHYYTATSLYNLAGYYHVQCKYTQAESLYQSSLSTREKAFGKDHPDVAFSLIGLASVYQSQGNNRAAESLYQRSLNIFEQTFGKDHPNVAYSLSGLATAYQAQGKYLAESLHKNSLAIRENNLSKNHPDVARSLSNLAFHYYLRNKNEFQSNEDFPYWVFLIPHVIGIIAVFFGIKKLISFSNKRLYFRKKQQIESLYIRSLIIKRESLGKNHPDIADDLNKLAIL
ncbi:tetratricopeptide repeat protein [Methyloglobulus sp.]|uniref:tetratricopeptide repeat protein n=1 Tax=Methyloglobulus sp. TaxID=2518622 RepID=UPI0032B86CD4